MVVGWDEREKEKYMFAFHTTLEERESVKDSCHFFHEHQTYNLCRFSCRQEESVSFAAAGREGDVCVTPLPRRRRNRTSRHCCYIAAGGASHTCRARSAFIAKRI